MVALCFFSVVLLIGTCPVPTATAHFDNAKIEIYKAVTIPIIDGTYNMTLNRVQVGGQERLVDEWNDATWIQIPSSSGKVTAYSGYKYDNEFLYIAHDIPSVTVMNNRGSAGTCFDPMHDGGTQQAKPDDFVVLPYWKDTQTFEVWIRYGSSNGKYGPFQTVPTGLTAKSKMTPTPVLSKAHLFYELRIPLSVGNLSKYMGSTIGFSQEVYVNNVADNEYPYGSGGYAFIPDNYADAIFSENVNPNPSVPAIPEFPGAFAPVLLFIMLVVGQIIVRRRRIKSCV